MNKKKIIAVVLALLMVAGIIFTGCSNGGNDNTSSSIAEVSEETIMKITKDMSTKDLYQLLGDTYTIPTNDGSEFMATYIVSGNFVYSVTIHQDKNEPVGYDGQSLMNGLKSNTRALDTEYNMSVKAEKNLTADSKDKGFEININYKGDYNVSMDGFNIYSADGKLIDNSTKLNGKNTVYVDLMNPITAEPAAATVTTEATDNETTATTTEATTAAGSSDETTENATSDETTTETTTLEADEASKGNVLLGMLKISNDADETVYVELYSLGGESFIARVRL